MLAIGIDPGTAITGVGLVEMHADGSIHSPHWSVIRTVANSPLPERLEIIHRELTELLDKFHPETSAVESLFFSRNVRTAMSVGQARGVVLLALQQASIPITDYPPNEIKQGITGNGAADKQQVQMMVRSLLDLDETPQPDDAADALGVAIYHLQRAQFAKIAEASST